MSAWIMATRFAIRQLAIAGIVAPVWFITLVIVQGVLQPDYNHISLPISALAAWPAGWIQNLNSSCPAGCWRSSPGST